MKKGLICVCLLLALLLAGCTVVIPPESAAAPGNAAPTPSSAPPPATSAAEPTVPVTSAESTVPVTTGEPAVPVTTGEPGALRGVEMALTEGLVATPGCPWVELTVSFPKVGLAPSDRRCALSVELNGETVAEWPELELAPGLEQTVELEFSFARYQPDETAFVTAKLTHGERTLTAETTVAVDNYPDELWLAMRDDDLPYSIDVLRSQNVVIVYGLDASEAYTTPIRVFLCSTGNATPTGDYRLGPKREWGLLYGNVYGQYVSRITGDILFHSVPYARKQKDTLVTEEYNKLGTPASMGCVRLAVADVKWIYDNCPMGTPVHIFDTDTLTVERPERIPIDPDDPRACWDPTDPDEANPWNQ